MKKILCCLLMFCLMSTVIGGVLAEETSESAYDAFLLKKGVLISKEYIKESTVDAKSSGGYDYPIDLKIVTLMDIETKEIYKCLQMSLELYNGRNFADTTITLDADEVDSAITAFQYMADQISEKSLKDYTELVYMTNDGTSFYLTYSASDGFSFVVRNSSGVQYYDVSTLAKLAEHLTDVKPKLD